MLGVGIVTLEGPDLSGKTTLYNKLHKKTGYRWNIQDRSGLSMICFARQFNRPDDNLRRCFEKELSNLNNKLIILMPELNTLERRYRKRGDEIQTIDSLTVLYDIFCSEVEKIKNLPNVLVLKNDNVDSEVIAEKAIDFLSKEEVLDAKSAGERVTQFLRGSLANEHSLDISFFGKVQSNIEDKILQDPHEGSYYKEILWDFENTIRKELIGLNPYSAPQDLSSRRFYYSSSSCISSIHFMPRNDILKCFVVFRSTNAIKNSSIDISFVHFLIHELGSKYFSMCKNYDLSIRLNSAHILTETR